MTENKNADEKSQDKIRFGIRFKFSLAIIVLVAVIISTITVYIVIRERNLLENQIYQLIQRELIHLSNTTARNLGFDDLAIGASVFDIERIDYATYSFVLDPDSNIVHFFDDREEREAGQKLEDGIERDKSEPVNEGDIRVQIVPDPLDPAGMIHDFSMPVYIDQKQVATVVIGISDIIIREETANLLKAIIPISIMFLIISIAGSVVLTSVIIKPIKKLSEGASLIGQGDLDHRIDIKSSDELGRLAKEFNEMTQMIKEVKDREIETRLMNEQMEMAKDIQEGLNPMEFYNKDGIEIKGFTRAAKGVGGDYFDYIDIDNYRVGALVSDVSGKGVPASLVMVMIRTVFTTYMTREDIDCASVVKAINDSLSTDFAIDKFASLFFIIYDRRTEELVFSNAGQGPLICYRASLGGCTFAKLDGVPIGIMDDVDYAQAKVKLNKGDIVFMFTDGLTEMRNAEKEEYGLQRAIDLLINHHDDSAEDFMNILVEDIDKFRGDVPPHDDMTMLVFKRSY